MRTRKTLNDQHNKTQIHRNTQNNQYLGHHYVTHSPDFSINVALPIESHLLNIVQFNNVLNFNHNGNSIIHKTPCRY